MALPQGIPILTYGKEASNSKELSELLAPDYDGKPALFILHKNSNISHRNTVIHCCLLPDNSAVTEIPAVLGGEAITPISKLGSNVHRPAHERKIPRAVVFGGAIPDEDVIAVKQAARKSGVREGDVVWLAVKGDKSRGPPSADVIAAKIRELLGVAGL